MWREKGPEAGREKALVRKTDALMFLGNGRYTWGQIAVLTGWKNAKVARQTVQRILNKEVGRGVKLPMDNARLSDDDLVRVARGFPPNKYVRSGVDMRTFFKKALEERIKT